jgi:ferredoxin
MPSNINFSFKEEFVSFLLRKNAKYVDYIAENITSKKEVKYTLIEKLRSKLNKKKLDSIINQSKNFTVDKDKCVRCRRCTSSCPTSNIKYDKFARKIIFLNRCQACNRCVTYCPSNAIDAYKLSSLKIDKTYNFISCLKDKTYDFKNEKDKLYLSYKSYFEKIESL